jgi:hypothetical protein
VVVRTKNGKSKQDKRGRILTKPVPMHYCYLTNLSTDEGDPDQLSRTTAPADGGSEIRVSSGLF